MDGFFSPRASRFSMGSASDRAPLSPRGYALDQAHLRAVGQALLVTLLWSSSYVLIKVGLAEIPALTFAGLRYAIAAVALLPVFLYRAEARSIRRLSRRDLGLLVLLGLLFYTATQGAQFLALQYLRAATVSLLLSFTPVIVGVASIPLLGERMTVRQWIWLAVVIAGVGGYFYPFGLASAAVLGVGIMAFGTVANALGSILGRYANRDDSLSPIAVTTVSMAVGSSVLLASGLLVQGLPSLSLGSWLIVLWLALVNTAFAFTLWNRTLQTLTATESSVINNTMLVQIAVLGWVFLGESLAHVEVAGLVLVTVGILAVQLTRGA
jgi:drug/metabolite transporter (DMT)-like permease